MKDQTITLNNGDIADLFDAIADSNDMLRDSIETMENDPWFDNEDGQEDLEVQRKRLATNEELYDKIGEQLKTEP